MPPALPQVFGLHNVGAHWTPAPSRLIGDIQPEKEDNATCGKIKGFLEQTELALVNTFTPAGATFYSDHRNLASGRAAGTRLDYVGLAPEMIKNIKNESSSGTRRFRPPK